MSKRNHLHILLVVLNSETWNISIRSTVIKHRWSILQYNLKREIWQDIRSGNMNSFAHARLMISYELTIFGITVKHTFLLPVKLRKSISIPQPHISWWFVLEISNWSGSTKQLCGKRFLGPLATYVKLRVAHAPGMPGTFSPPPRVSDPDMHPGTCVTHVPWCMLGSLTSSFIWSGWRGKRSRHSRCMRNPQFYVSGKRPMPLRYHVRVTYTRCRLLPLFIHVFIEIAMRHYDATRKEKLTCYRYT